MTRTVNRWYEGNANVPINWTGSTFPTVLSAIQGGEQFAHLGTPNPLMFRHPTSIQSSTSVV